MRPETIKYFEEVRQACWLLEQFTLGKSFPDYEADPLLQAGVEREFITIGEALTQAEKLEPGLDNSISALRQIIGFRNLLVHRYAILQNATVWGIVENDLPVLIKEVKALLGTSGTP